MTSKVEFKFHKLSPRSIDEGSSSFKIIKQALDEAYLDDDIKNIAITGIYGSGKSSFLKTYYKASSEKEVINVDVADFEDGTPEKSKIKTAERQIINQILYQIPSYKVPMSKFKVKKKRKFLQVTGYSIWLFISIVGLYSLFNSSYLNLFFSQFIPEESITFWVSRTIIMFITLSLILVSVWLSRRVSLKLIRINYKGTESELLDGDEAELLDHEARELVYLIVSSDVKTIIFEDLDRFEDISIFIRLREINSLVNTSSDEIIRFIYVIKDDLFESKDRTKFFDMMIPVIPHVTSYNSRGKIIELFSDISDEYLRVDNKVLEQISIYIDDMRLIYSIRNEYEIYSKSIDTDAYANELFALIVLKNVFPKDFSELEHDKGYLYTILNKRGRLVEDYETTLNKKIEEREELKNQLIVRFSDFISINIPKDYGIKDNESFGKIIFNWSLNKDEKLNIYKNNQSYFYTFDQFIEKLCKEDSSLKKRLEQVDYDDFDIRIKKLNDEIKDLKEDIDRRYTTETSVLLAELDSESLEEYFEEKNNKYKEINQNHYFPLIRYLVLSGLVDENYWRYKGYFHEGYLGKDDNLFINRVLSGKPVKNNFKLNNPKLVIEYLTEIDYARKDIVNYNLIDELLNQRKEKEIKNIISVIISTKDIEAAEYINDFEYFKLKTLVELLLENGFKTYYYAFSSNVFSSELKLKLAGIACEHGNIDPNIEFKKYLAENSEILEQNILSDENALIDELVNLQIKFENITELETTSAVGKRLIERRLFVLNIPNIVNLIRIISDNSSIVKEQILSKIFEYVYTEAFKELKAYLEDDLENIINEYIEIIEESEIRALPGEVALVNILNSELSVETKRRFIIISESKINDIKSVEDDRILTDLFDNNLTDYNQRNITNYFERIGELESIIEYMNNNYKVEFSLSQEIYQDLLHYKATDYNLYQLISEELDNPIQSISSDLSMEKYMILVQKKLVQFNKDNFEILLETQNDELIIVYLNYIRHETPSEDILTLILKNEFVDKLSINVLTTLLNLRILTDDDSKKLLDRYNKEVSLFSILDATTRVREYILESYFIESDYQDIIDKYETFDLKIQFMNKLNRSVNVWDGLLSYELTEKFVNSLIESDYLNDVLKLKLLIKIIKKESYVSSWEKWISSVDFIKKMSVVFSNKLPKISTQEQNEVALALEEIELITIGQDRRLYLRPSKFKKMKMEETSKECVANDYK